jgi:hypothetical protein
MPKDPNVEFTRDMLKAFEDLGPDAFAEFRRMACELLGISIEALAQGRHCQLHP